MIYDLNPAKPRLIDELEEAVHIFDANKFVEMGFMISYCQENKELKKGYVQKSLEQSPFRNLIFETLSGSVRRIFLKFTSRDI